VTQGIDTDDVGLARWNPNGRSDWFHYVASSGSRDDMQPRLWHRETRQTFTLDVPNTTAEAPDISPDGKYLVVRALTPERNGYALHVQEVLDGELGGRWMIEGLRAPLERSGPQQRWQP
jgi:Tol biopolymer transport system component